MVATPLTVLAELNRVLQDWVVRGLIAGLISMGAWNAYELRNTRAAFQSELQSTREAFILHAQSMAASMHGIDQVTEIMLAPNPLSNSRKEPIIHQWIKDFNEGARTMASFSGRLEKIEIATRNIELNQGGLKNQLDEVLERLGGKKRRTP